MDLICSCGDCRMCRARGRMFENPVPQRKLPIKSPEEQAIWDKSWNKTLWNAKQLGKDYKRHWNELYGTKG